MEVSMSTFLKLCSAVGLLVVAGFCGFGFLATYEPSTTHNMLAWRIGYGLAGPIVLASAAWLAVGLIRRRGNRQTPDT
jgi:hypothetical protein